GEAGSAKEGKEEGYRMATGLVVNDGEGDPVVFGGCAVLSGGVHGGMGARCLKPERRMANRENSGKVCGDFVLVVATWLRGVF
ncbi:hypothetical protein HAX54_028410, partial [Datura stramonium]|nr:hypothetical protein [Datura stramonium]